MRKGQTALAKVAPNEVLGNYVGDRVPHLKTRSGPPTALHLDERGAGRRVQNRAHERERDVVLEGDQVVRSIYIIIVSRFDETSFPRSASPRPCQTSA